MMINRVGVVGCGIMGSGIAQVCAQAGLEVLISDKDESTLKRGKASVEKALQKLEERGKISASQKDSVLGRIDWTTDMGDFKTCDLVIEAVTENLELKKSLFDKLDKICRKDAVLATNTSVLPVSEMSRCTNRPGKVVGTHFLTPAPVNKLLEIVVTEQTSEDTLQAIKTFGSKVGKIIVVAKDKPGFVVNRILTSIMFNAVRLLEEGVATREDIEAAVEVGLGMPMGPLKLLDLIGIDTVVLGGEALCDRLQDLQYRPPQTLRKMAADNQLGRKAGRGFYRYPASPAKAGDYTKRTK